MIRRDLLKTLAALAALPAAAWADEPGVQLGPQAAPFGPNTVTLSLIHI